MQHVGTFQNLYITAGRKRELDGLNEAMRTFSLDAGFLLTYCQEERIMQVDSVSLPG
jgi:hypothetical protein